MDNIEAEQTESEWVSDAVNMDIDSWELFNDEKKEENEDNLGKDAGTQAKETDAWNVDDDFSISLDDESETSPEYNDNKVESEDETLLDSNENIGNEESIDDKDDLEKSEEDLKSNQDEIVEDNYVVENDVVEDESFKKENSTEEDIRTENEEEFTFDIWDSDSVVESETVDNEVEDRVIKNEDDKSEDVFEAPQADNLGEGNNKISNENSQEDINIEAKEDMSTENENEEEFTFDIWDTDSAVERDAADNEVEDEAISNEDDKPEDIFEAPQANNLEEENNEISDENWEEDKVEDNEEISIENEKAEEEFTFDIWDSDNVIESDSADNDIVEDKVVANENNKLEDIFEAPKADNQEENNEISIEDSQENINIEAKEDMSTEDEKEEEFTFDIWDDNSTENDVENNVDENNVFETSAENNQEWMFFDKAEDSWKQNLDKWTDINSNGWESTENSGNENNVAPYQEASLENNISFTLDSNEQESLKQPELWDLLWNSLEEQGNSTSWTEDNFSWEANLESITTQENVGLTQENNNNEGSQAEENNYFTDNNIGNQTFTLDYQDSTENESQKLPTEMTSSDSFVWVDSEGSIQMNREENAANINANQEAIVQEVIVQPNQSEPQQITSTLSLDQILDTELNNNPQFADNSKAVPINVSSKNGLFGNKKLTWILAWVWLFLLAWITAVLAFPGIRNFDWTSWSIENTDEVIQDDDEHNSASLEPEIWDKENDEWKKSSEWDTHGELNTHGELDTGQEWWEIAPHPSKATVQQPDFPDAGRDDEEQITNEPENSKEEDDIKPYTCDWDDCSRENKRWGQDTQLEIRSVIKTIESFKSEAEIYYSQWDELQDKKLVRYAAQAINLCETYQEQVNNGEWLDKESFDLFKSRIDKLLNKMKDYLGWENNI